MHVSLLKSIVTGFKGKNKSFEYIATIKIYDRCNFQGFWLKY